MTTREAQARRSKGAEEGGFMKRELTYATVCSGVECCSVACIGLPMRPIFFSEIEPFPCAVLKAHYPDVPNLGDMSKIQVSENGLEITNGTTRIILDRRIDLLAGGTPCQSVSVAGKGEGMREGSGTRSSLAFDFVRLARELRPRWIVWENVANVLSAKHAGDFLHFLANLGDCGYSLAWRVLDAQYVRVDGMERAVPQRRRRVWVVGCLGADESAPAQILFEPDCVAGHTAPRRRAGQGFAYTLAGRDRVDAGVVGDATERGTGGGDAIALDGDKLKPREDQRKGGNGFGVNEEGAGYTPTGMDRHGVAYSAQGGDVASTITRQISEQSGQENHADGGDVAETIDANYYKGQGSRQGVERPVAVQCYENHAQDSRIKQIEVSDTRSQKDGTGGNNLPLVVMAYRPPIQDLIAEACAKYGANWPEDDWVEITDGVVLNIYTDMDGRRRATAFQKSDANLEFGVDISYVGDGAVGRDRCFSKVSHPTAPNGEGERWDEREVAQTRNTFDNGEKRCQEVVVSMAQNTRDEVRIVGGDGQIAGSLPAEPGMKQQTYVVSTNSNGEDVAATLDHNTGTTNGIGAQNDKRGGYVVTKQGVMTFQETGKGYFNSHTIAETLRIDSEREHKENNIIVTKQEGAEGE